MWQQNPPVSFYEIRLRSWGFLILTYPQIFLWSLYIRVNWSLLMCYVQKPLRWSCSQISHKLWVTPDYVPGDEDTTKRKQLNPVDPASTCVFIIAPIASLASLRNFSFSRLAVIWLGGFKKKLMYKRCFANALLLEHILVPTHVEKQT